MPHIVIVGGGLAAGTAAEKLRDEGFDGDITVVAAEQYTPYQRPPLSKGYLQGEEGADAVVLHPDDWYAQHRIGVRTGVAATSLEVAAHRVVLDDGSTLAYDSILLATGAQPRSLPLPGIALEGVTTLRRRDDADRLADALRSGGRRLVVIGAGWIGMEVAASARQLGNKVTVVDRDPVPLATALGAEMGAVFRALHEEHDTTVRTSAAIEAVTGDDRAQGVVVDGDEIPADLVVVGVGAVPDTALAETAGVRLLNGILTDSSMRTDAPDVFAAGDVANPYHPVVQRHLRSEHWDNAIKTGEVAARAMLGLRASHRSIPYFYTDQYDLGMELSGYAPLMSSADVVVRGDRDAREFIAFWVDDGTIVGGMNVNVWDVNESVQALIRSGARVDLDALRDPAVPLDSLLSA
ncbi:3-phenylpropionate/trans-cinnamate dioxygenase ferredoxin reductase subunit [Microbacterium terrae]|uniref:Rhodocoxin reductase n=1 Tax=Microbacterium terrae TaxID=69369 RepID=A0A0M2HCV9_9MICO|nr:FAD-dependent oxidoreductase [Microbacterium terrae]KJL42049.1 Rhodocoxin reductase [Microbacterium terrae]MBP1076688.1 3-phenylpropionate/trans-cinnamate dioxygenase ferredoxin reductase subunit [Microbacterium terrae]GLJ97516.1 pyridine nucleotide-disulfide oxidoreductase [Microbacterium terrae]